MLETKTTDDVILDELKRDLAEWMEAKEDLVCRPPIDVAVEGDEFVARALVPGFNPDDIQIEIAPDILLVKGNTERDVPAPRRLMRAVKFPRPVDPDKVEAEIHDGMLSIKAAIAGPPKANPFLLRAA